MRTSRIARALVTGFTLLLALNPIAATTFARARVDLRDDESAQRERNWEEQLRAVPSPERLKEYMRILASEPHHIGSPACKRNAEWIRDQFKSWGLKASIEEFEVLFPTPKERVLEVVEPTRFTATLKEPQITADPDSGDAGQLPTYNAYSGDGDVTAPLVYVNYGVPADYEYLEKQNIDVKGKIVIARYGASWRGIKPKVAYDHGAVGCIIYSDPRDDGYFQGDVYPDGPFRPEQGVQRGSVMDMPIYPGDPLTPGWGSVKGARRLDRSEAKTLMKIPVLPISYGDALPILRQLRGPSVPEAWRGALPITYHIGSGSARVHMKVVSDWSLHTLYDVIGRIDGSVFPDEWVIRGNHHDGWVNGASDPTSGQIAMLEEARAFGVLLGKGWRPKRTMIFAAWDGEEPGLLGSTEWAEQHAEELSRKAVAYINSDSNGKGMLGVSGSHSLERFVSDVARAIPNPKGTGMVSDAVRERRGAQTQGEDRRDARTPGEMRIGALGSGSDYTVFIDHLGIASLNLGFGGEGGGGVYHSIYDSISWYEKFSDSTYEYGRALSQMAGTVMLRLADATILPFDFTRLAETINGYAEEIAKLPSEGVDLAPLRKSVEKLRLSAQAYDRALRSFAFNGGSNVEHVATTKALNESLLLSERSLLADGGLPRRSWFKHQIYAPGFYTGYGVKTLPGVREAIEQKNWSEASAEVGVISRTLDAMTAHIDEATKLIEKQ
jgi:N-acetylated-alpha-linked acidic dipeptidase